MKNTLKNTTITLAGRSIGLAILMSCLLVACEPDMESKEEVTQDVAPAGEAEMLYDAALAAKLGADEYGMKSYVMAFLKAGPNRSQDSLEAARLQSAHLANISRMAKAGDLVMAGPFMDDGAVRGIYIFDVETVEEAEALTSTDPAIQAGRLVMELHPWYGSAALVELNTRHQQIQKTQF